LAKILFISAHDWLFAQRHLVAVRAARELDLSVVVATRVQRHARLIEAAGARVVDIDIGTSLKPPALWRLVSQLRNLLAAEQPVVTHWHGLRLLVAGIMGMRMAPIGQHVFVPGGLGRLGRGDDVQGKFGLMLARGMLAPMVTESAHLVFDNPDDPALLGLAPSDAGSPGATPAHPRIHVMPGLGVDPLIHSVEPMPWLPPLKLAFGSALLWANGPDLAVEAVTRARAAGADVTLSLIGRVCQPGRQAVPEATLMSWSRMPGINWFAPTTDTTQVWRQHHALVVPSRGGDGLPLLMTEAASAGRAILTTDVEGCRSFVRNGIDGLLVPKGDAEALARAIIDLASAPGLVERMGRNAREQVVEGYTERHVMDEHKKLWRSMLQTAVMA
jgi:hypothetical protein